MPRLSRSLFVLALFSAVAGLALAGPPSGGGPGDPYAPPFGAPPASDFGDSRDRVSVTVKADRTRVARGSDLAMIIVLDHSPGWHIWTNEREIPDTYAIFGGAIHAEAVFTADIDGALTVHEARIQWPEFHGSMADVGEGPQEFATFSGRVVLYIPVTIPDDAPLGPVTLTTELTFQACDATQCIMPAFDAPYELELEVVDAGSEDDATTAGDFASFPTAIFDALEEVDPDGDGDGDGDDVDPATGDAVIFTAPPVKFFGWELPRPDGPAGLLLIALFSAIGGFILNLTPCVLPVIPIKILTISQHAGTPGKALMLGTWMAIGVVAFWAAIGVPVAFVSSFTDPSRLFGIWWITLGIGVLILVMGIGIMGLFTLNLPNAVYMVNPKADSAWGSFLFGVMTAVLGLPCFGFVAGALLAGAATMPAGTILLIFTSLGVGMAAPYLFLAMMPGLVDHIPRTGPASELVKQVMGLMLIAASAFFIGTGTISFIANHPYMAKELHWWAIAACFVVTGGWLLYRTIQITPVAGRRLTFGLIAVFIGVPPLLYAVSRTATAHEQWVVSEEARVLQGGSFTTETWNRFTPALYEQAKAEGYVVILDFTADWCLTCQALKATVLDREPVKSELEAEDTVAFLVDCTASRSPGWDLLEDLGIKGIPLLAIFGPGRDQPWLSPAYNGAQVMDGIESSRAKE